MIQWWFTQDLFDHADHDAHGDARWMRLPVARGL
jgi:hypothetical protein